MSLSPSSFRYSSSFARPEGNRPPKLSPQKRATEFAISVPAAALNTGKAIMKGLIFTAVTTTGLAKTGHPLLAGLAGAVEVVGTIPYAALKGCASFYGHVKTGVTGRPPGEK